MTLREHILEILDGIQRTEDDENPGWWETSEQAAFGLERLNLVLQTIDEEIPISTELGEEPEA